MSSKPKNKEPFTIRFVKWIFPRVEAVWPWLAHQYFIYIFFTPFRYSPPKKEAEFMKTAAEFSVTLEGKHIQCYRWGSAGPTVLLVHGWAGRAGQFRSFVPALMNAGYQVIAFDGPAHGKSEGKQTDVIEFAKLIKQLGELTAIIAHSFGGVAALYAVAIGVDVKKVINISSPSVGAGVIHNFRRAVGASEAAGRTFEKYILKKWGRPFEEFSSVYSVQHLKSPIDLLMIQDEGDPEVPASSAAEMKKAYPATVVHFTQGLGHTRILKDESIISMCVAFLK